MTSSTHPFEQEEVMAYLDGELSANRAVSVAVHLRECTECAALAEQMRDVSIQLSNWSVEAAPASLTKNLEAARADHALVKETKRGRFAGWLTGKFPSFKNRWVWGAAGAAAVIVLLFAIGRPTRRREQHAEGLAQLAYTEQSRSAETAPSKSAASEVEAFMAQSRPSPPPVPEPTQPMIARTASVSLIVKDFGPLEATVKAIALRHNGYIASLNSTSPQEAARTLTATLRIPSAQLESVIAELKQFGRVEQESQSGEEVTKEFTDRAARMKNARATEESYRPGKGHPRNRAGNRTSPRRHRANGSRSASAANPS